MVVEGSVFTGVHAPTAINVYSGKKISLNGTGMTQVDTRLNDAGIFSCVIKVQDSIITDNNLQAIFEGDEHYTQSSSNIVSYETARHDTKLTIQIDPLRLSIPFTQTELEQKVILKPNDYFRIAGLLLDSSLNVPIPSKRIYFEKEFDLMIYDITKEDGTYYIEKLKTPEQPGQYKIRALFEGDDKYNDSKSSETTILIQEPVHDQDYSIAENLKKMPLSLEQLQESKEISILQAFRLFHAFNYIEKGFEEEKEDPQIISTIWLLSLLEFNPVPLGIYIKNGENLEINGNILNSSADILASNNTGYSLVIDCTVGVPAPDKLDKLLNTAKYLGGWPVTLTLTMLSAKNYSNDLKK